MYIGVCDADIVEPDCNGDEEVGEDGCGEKYESSFEYWFHVFRGYYKWGERTSFWGFIAIERLRRGGSRCRFGVG